MNIEILHEYPVKERDKGLIMLPIGVVYNRSLQKAFKGDSIKFFRGEVCRIISMSYLNLKSQIAGFLSMYLYGVDLKVVMKRWKANAVAEGNSSKVISEEKCLLVWYEKLEEESKKKSTSPRRK